MNPVVHLLQLKPAPLLRDSEAVQVPVRIEAPRGVITFRATALPTPHQLNNELPFTVNFPPHFRERP